MPKFNPPKEFSFIPAEWDEWRQRFTRYRIASKLRDDQEEVQVNSLIYSMGIQAESIFKSFTFENEGDKLIYSKVLAQFDAYFNMNKNAIHQRALFQECRQSAGETVEQFIRRMYELTETCEYKGDGLREEMIRDRLVVGIKDKTVSQLLQIKKNLTLAQAIEIARTHEAVKQNTTDGATAANGADASLQVDAVTKGKYRHRNQSRKPDVKLDSPCGRCGHEVHKGGKCPAIAAKCRKCHRKGHYADLCRSKDLKEVVMEPTVQQPQVNPPVNLHVPDHSYFLGSLDAGTIQDNEPPWEIKAEMYGQSISFKIDSGADITVMNYDQYMTLKGRPALTKSDTVLSGVGGRPNCKGQFAADINVNGRPCKLNIYVVEDLTTNLLSRGAAVNLGLIMRVHEISDEIFGDIGTLKGESVKITLQENAEPYSASTARRIPIPLLPKVESELKRMEDAGVITKVTEPTEWCAPIVPVMKKTNEVRICVDLRRLNAAVKREKYILPKLEEALGKLAGSTVYSSLDAASGYHQLPLDEASSKLTTFITPFGRYRFLKLPFGVSCASEIFQRKMVELLGGVDGVSIWQDDILVHGRDQVEHDQRLKKVMDILLNSGLKLRKAKCVFRQDHVKYLGHRISKEGVSPHPDKIRAIQDLLPPENVSELRRVMGMINYLGRYMENLADITKPMNMLLKNDTVWQWGPDQEKAFNKVKQAIITAPTLAHYDVDKQTMVSSDASSYGIGGLIQQLHGSEWKPVAYCSRTLNDTEQRYAQIEKELLAATWVCEKFSTYLVGLPSFLLQVDHKPLIPLINATDIDRAPIRCQRMLMRLMRFNVKAEYVAGKTLVVADTLSRSPVKQFERELSADITTYVHYVIANKPMSDDRLEEIRALTEDDNVLQEVIHYTLNGWPKYKKDVNIQLHAYHDIRHELSVASGLLMRGSRIVVPDPLREDILQRIHHGHQGMVKCRERANQAVWWPAINTQIQQTVSACEHCQVNRPSQGKEPLIPTELPDRPWLRIGVDICEYNKKMYMVGVDYYSRYMEIIHMPNITSATTIATLKNMFARWGIPEEVISDNATTFMSQDFQSFAKESGFRHITSSPHFPQSNGEAERAVQTAKKILRQPDPSLALMTYRATPHSATGYSPAELIMGRKMRTTLPIASENLKPKWPDHDKVKVNDQQAKENNAYYHDRGSRPLPPLRVGDTVRMKTSHDKTWSEPGTVIQQHDTPRSYIVSTPSGTYRRNRSHLLKIPNQDINTVPAENVPNMSLFDTDEPMVNDQGLLAGNTAEPVRRSGRDRRPPDWMNTDNYEF